MQHATADNGLSTPIPTQPYSRLSRAAFGVLVGLEHIFALAPFLLLATLFAASWRAAALIGHWPKVYVDDPWYLAPDDALYVFLFGAADAIIRTFQVPFFGLPVLTILIAALRPKYPKLWLAFLVLTFAVGMLLLKVDPGDRLLWHAD